MAFGTDARRHQASFLATAACFSEAARARTTDGDRRNTHLIAPGHQLENLYPSLRDCSAQEFFATRSIKWWSSTRSGDAKSFNGPTRNLASSQVACVNFLMPFAENPGVLTSILRGLDSDVDSATRIEYQDRKTGAHLNSFVEFEWIGLTSTLEGGPYTRGANATSADALIVANIRGGKKRAYLFEWKYVEEYKEDDSKGVGPAGDTRRKRYGPLYAASDGPFNRSVSLDSLLFDPFYQLMRLGLLARKMVVEREFGVSEARVVVVSPKENLAYRTRITSTELKHAFPNATVGEVMQRVSVDPRLFASVSPSELAAPILEGGGPIVRPWAEYHSARYGW